MKAKKYQLLIPIPFLLVIITPGLVWAADDPVAIFANPLQVSSITELLAKVLDIVVQVGLVFIVFFIIFAGFQFVTARGDTTKITKAREALVATLIGSAIVLGSYAIVTALNNTVCQLREGTGVTQCE